MATTVDGPSATDGSHRETALVKNILVFTWAFCTLLWSIFTRPELTFPARSLLIQPLWLLRILWKDSTWIQDLALFELVHAAYTHCTGAWTSPTMTSIVSIDFTNRTSQMYAQLFTLLGGCVIWAGLIVFRGSRIGASSNDVPEPLQSQTIDEQVLPPLLLTSRTNHSRLIPKKHSFSYSYLLVGIPVGVKGRISTVLSVDSEKRGWFSVDSADHLDRDDRQSSLAEKLKRYLHTQGVTDRDYAFAYLVTAPRFAGYNFNPVSFWYLYDSETRLKYMVLEVNNTFDERRMYLLRGNQPISSVDPVERSESMKRSFSEVWEKDFHVSPFNSRKGTYSLNALDPLAHYEETGEVRIDNTIVLRSSKESSKIVARVFTEGSPKDPGTISTSDLAKFIAGWWWVGFATFPRIVWEAGKLFFKRKLYIWYRPEVVATSIGRAYSADEQVLESFFKPFLTQTVAESTKPLRVIYESAHSNGNEIVMYSPGFTYEEDHQRTLTLKVLSPAFYSRFIHYAHAKEAFDRECLATDEKNRTLVIERPELLPTLLSAMHDQCHPSVKQPPSTILEAFRWSCFQRLRCPPGAHSYPSALQRSVDDYRVSDIRTFKTSELDAFVRYTRTDANLYRRTALKLFLAERFTFGLPPLLAGLDILLRGVLVLLSMLFSDKCHAIDILRPRPFDRADLSTFVLTVLLANAVHLWSFIKG